MKIMPVIKDSEYKDRHESGDIIVTADTFSLFNVGRYKYRKKDTNC